MSNFRGNHLVRLTFWMGASTAFSPPPEGSLLTSPWLGCPPAPAPGNSYPSVTRQQTSCVSSMSAYSALTRKNIKYWATSPTGAQMDMFQGCFKPGSKVKQAGQAMCRCPTPGQDAGFSFLETDYIVTTGFSIFLTDGFNYNSTNQTSEIMSHLLAWIRNTGSNPV